MGKAKKKLQPKLCERCGKRPADSKLQIGGVTFNGKSVLKGDVRQEICGDCAVRTMREFTAAFTGVA